MAAADAALALSPGVAPGSPLRLAFGLGRRRRAPARLAPEAVSFQEDLEELIAERPPPLFRGLPWWVALLFFVLFGIACVARVDVVVIGAGRLATDAPPLVLQPMERAVIRELRVRPGDVVSRGQVLALLDPTFTDSDRAALAAQRRSLRAQLDRLEAEAASQPPGPPPEDPDAALQAVLHAQRHALRAARLRAFDEEIRSNEAAIRSLDMVAAPLAEQVSIAREVELLRQRLLEGQIGSRLNLLSARAQRLAAEKDEQQARSRIEELRHALLSRQADRQAFLDDWQRQLTEETVRLRGDLMRVEEALAKAERMGELTVMTAPQDGVVLDIARRSAGSVLREAEALITLVPSGVPLIAEISLSSTDVGHVRAGDDAAVKVDAFPFQRHGQLRGRLRAVAQDSHQGVDAEAGIRPTPGAAQHRAQVVLDDARLPGMAEDAMLLPGMTVAAEIRVGTRTVISYFLDPLLRGLRESLREP